MFRSEQTEAGHARFHQSLPIFNTIKVEYQQD